MRIAWPTTVILLCALVTAPVVRAQPPVIQYYIEATQARDAEDYDGYVRAMREALAEVPGHAILLRHIAQGYALSNRPEQAVGTLLRVAETGAYFDLSAYDELAALAGEPGFERAREALEHNLTPLGQATTAFTVADPLLIPEGIAYDPINDVFFLSSVHQRKVVAVDRHGEAMDFVIGGDDFYCGLGMKVVAQRRRLWVVTAAFEGMRDYSDALEGCSSVSCYDAESGHRLRHFVLPNRGTPYILNDLTLDSHGRVYLTDSGAGNLYMIEPEATEPEAFVADGSLRGGNGIALDEERGILYVARYGLDIVGVDVGDASVFSLRQPDDVALYGVDGLYLHDGALIAIQNHPSLERVTRFDLTRDGRRITGSEVLLRRHPLFDEPTTGVIVGDRFYLIGNSQIERFVHGTGATELAPTRILAIDL